MNHLLNILDGFSSILDFNLKPGRCYVRNGFRADQRNLKSDVLKVGADLKKSVSDYGQQSSSRARFEQKR